jgi:hypothetical protein
MELTRDDMQLKVIPVERYPHLMERLQAAENQAWKAFRDLVRFEFDLYYCRLMAQRTYADTFRRPSRSAQGL